MESFIKIGTSVWAVEMTHTDRHTDAQTHRRTDAQTLRRTDAQTHRRTDTQKHRHTDAQTELILRVKTFSPEMTEYENTDIHEDKGLYTDLRN